MNGITSHRTFYLAGPMCGHDNNNVPAFVAEAARQRARGREIVSPAELHDDTQQCPESHYLRVDLAALLLCDAVIVLDGWDDERAPSAGTHLELLVAAATGRPVYDVRDCPVSVDVGSLAARYSRMHIRTTEGRPEELRAAAAAKLWTHGQSMFLQDALGNALTLLSVDYLRRRGLERVEALLEGIAQSADGGLTNRARP